MFETRKVEELELMYKIFAQVKGGATEVILEFMTPYIESEGQKIISKPENLKDPIKFTEDLLKLKEDMDNIILSSFENNIQFQKKSNESFQKFMSECNKTPHFLALYLDNLFKKNIRTLSDGQIEDILDSQVRLFCCLNGRDTFILAYSNLLAMRLINKSTLSNKAEELMIKKLQVECGHNTVNKIKTMFEDMIKS